MAGLITDVYDLTMLSGQVGNDSSSLQRFIDIFTTTVHDDMQTLKEAIDWEDYDKARSAAHKMKSSYGIMGATWAHTLCMEIEDSAKNRTETEKLPEKYQELSDGLDKMLLLLSQITF